ncbi:MAG: hypothetical protein CMM52_00220 [Rhodospirillaceae bacterium]|nr:hypothetical protein [Rhodospirillaceae bacterium]|tara:strand:+ start:11754 stop:12461 length:708 start_codon:yes stop_codon:yes gene_type:complete
MTDPQTSSGDRPALTKPEQLFPLVRQFSYRLTKLLLLTPLTPNHVTALSLLSGLAAAWFFAQGNYQDGLIGGALFVLGYTLDNCDGEIARLKNLSSEFGAKFDDVVDWLVDSVFFIALGYGTWIASDTIFWFWCGVAATVGATIDYVVDLFYYAGKEAEENAQTREEQAVVQKEPENIIDWLILIFHKFSRADFCMIVFALALFDILWLLLPAAAIGAQAYWITDLFNRARGWRI